MSEIYFDEEDACMTPAAEAGLLMDREAQAPQQRPRRAVIGAFSAAAVMAAAAAVLLLFHGKAAPAASVQPFSFEFEVKAEEKNATQEEEVEEEAPGPCVGLNEECTTGKCCWDGGAGGFQCYAKNEGWAQCLESCEAGVHDGEKMGDYDQWGTFHPQEWSCKKQGKRSLPGCESYEKTKCDEKRCTWLYAGNGTCAQGCFTLGSADACGQKEHCQWKEDKCLPACNTYGEEGKCPTDRCAWSGDKTCITACWMFSQDDACDKTRCIWEENQCKVDPCSAPGENCLDTKCCSPQRGGSGQTCFRKDKFYGSCMAECSEEGWDCTKEGNRTKWQAGCSWPGDDCSTTHLCCQEGFACAKKDDLFTGCVQTQEKSTWSTKQVEIPGSWDGTVYGGSRAEYSIPPASDGNTAGTSLFCFMAYLPGTEEVNLMNVAKEMKASIFACDYSSVYESWNSGSNGWDTGEATLMNTDVFLNVWKKVEAEGMYLKADWTAKADPDCVIVPDRLKAHIAALNPPAGMPIYLKNNGMDPGMGNNGFLGAIEVFSKQAIQIYLDNDEGCKKAYGLNTGEDGFFKGCMDSLGVGFMLDFNMFNPDKSAGACNQEDKAAFHPLKEADQWRCCVDIIMGKPRNVDYGHCDEPAPDAPEEGEGQPQ